jgi:hypothetical protein
VTILLAQEEQHIELSIQDVSIVPTVSISHDRSKGEREPDATPIPLDADNANPTLPKMSRGPGLGILGMRERARLLGGTLTIHSQIGHGTTVQAIIPYPAMQNMREIFSQDNFCGTSPQATPR